MLRLVQTIRKPHLKAQYCKQNQHGNASIAKFLFIAWYNTLFTSLVYFEYFHLHSRSWLSISVNPSWYGINITSLKITYELENSNPKYSLLRGHAILLMPQLFYFFILILKYYVVPQHIIRDIPALTGLVFKLALQQIKLLIPPCAS